MQQRSYAEAEKLYRETLDMARRVLGPDHPNSLSSIGTLAGTLASEKLYHDTIDAQRRVLGAEHPDTASSTYSLACIAVRQGRRDEALSLLREAINHGLPARQTLAMENDQLLAPLHGDPRFEALVSDARHHAAAIQKSS